MSEKKPIVRLFFAKMKEAFIALPDEEKAAFMRKDRKNIDELGMKAVAMVDCHWSTDEWDYVGVEQWPSMDAIKAREQFEIEELEIAKYAEFKFILGTPESFDEYGKE